MSQSNEEPTEYFAVTPLKTCPHIDQIAEVPDEGLNVKKQCNKCPNMGENWVCLKCYEVSCSRFVQGHAKEHFDATQHALALSLADLSVWCYVCDAYLDNDALAPAISAAKAAKFGDE